MSQTCLPLPPDAGPGPPQHPGRGQHLELRTSSITTNAIHISLTIIIVTTTNYISITHIINVIVNIISPVFPKQGFWK